MSSSIEDIQSKIFHSPLFQLKINDFNHKRSSLNQLEAEFICFYQICISNKHIHQKINRNEIILYTDFLCDLMVGYYECNDAQEKLDEFKKYKYEIASLKESISPKNYSNKEVSPYYFLRNKIKENTVDYIFSFRNPSKWRDYISNLNSNRLYWYYCHDLVESSLNFAQKNYIKEYSIDNFLNLLDKPNEILRAMSVIIYALRLIIDGVSILKNVIISKERSAISTEIILIQEIEKTGFSLLNDFVWGTVNLLTNYNNKFHISDIRASNIAFIFLGFDAMLLMTIWLFEATKYKHRIQEIKYLKTQVTHKPEDLEIINRQLDILSDQWEIQSAYCAMNVIAATCLALGIGGGFLLSGGLAFYFFAFLKMLGTVLYATADEYKNYIQSITFVQRELVNNQLEANPTLLDNLKKDAKHAQYHFWKTLAYNTGGPVFFIAIAAISWPISLIITAAYMSYQLSSEYQKTILDHSQLLIEKNDRLAGIYRLFYQPEKKEKWEIYENTNTLAR